MFLKLLFPDLLTYKFLLLMLQNTSGQTLRKKKYMEISHKVCVVISG